MSTLLNVEKLSIGYSKVLQENLDFQVNEGEILNIKGRNGSGKSTLIKTLLNQIPPIQGEINWTLNKKSVSFLPQIVNHDFPLAITLGEILELFELPSEVKEIYLSNLLNRKFNDASGGEKQKTLILTRLSKGVDFLILDEPFNHLDKKATLEVMNFINNLVSNKIIKGIILISHIDSPTKDVAFKEVHLL